MDGFGGIKRLDVGMLHLGHVHQPYRLIDISGDNLGREGEDPLKRDAPYNASSNHTQNKNVAQPRASHHHPSHPSSNLHIPSKRNK